MTNTEQAREKTSVKPPQSLCSVNLDKCVASMSIWSRGRIFDRLKLPWSVNEHTYHPSVRTMNRVFTTHRGLVQQVLAAPAVMALRIWFKKSSSPDGLSVLAKVILLWSYTVKYIAHVGRYPKIVGPSPR